MIDNTLNLAGKCILVTGASSGIGRATAQLLAQRGARIVGLARDSARLEETRASLAGSNHVVRGFDLEDSSAIGPLVQSLVQETAPLSGMVHAAGIQQARPLRIARAEDFLAHYRVNALAAAMLLAVVSKRGVAAENGCSVVLVGSVMSELGAAGLSAYCSSKAALVGLVRAAALELAPLRIRVNAVLPGVVDTDMSRRHLAALGAEHVRQIEQMHPLGFGQADDVAQAIAFLASDAARWITGTCLTVDGGYSAQ